MAFGNCISASAAYRSFEDTAFANRQRENLFTSALLLVVPRLAAGDPTAVAGDN
ncbi:hypothetical protein [Amycolatopsis sp. NPDC051128]|uniref:hypothetical protein n=1 Tax=Amycolatopsis sp. NPDC051128 TaxID=3155412 RepID=UPI00343A392D